MKVTNQVKKLLPDNIFLPETEGLICDVEEVENENVEEVENENVPILFINATNNVQSFDYSKYLVISANEECQVAFREKTCIETSILKDVLDKWGVIMDVIFLKKEKFLYYNYYPTLTNHIIDYPLSHYKYFGVKPKHNYPKFDINNIKDGDIVFVKVDLLQHFFSQIYPQIRSKFILYSGVGCLKVPVHFKAYLDQGKIIKWYGTNIVWTHPLAEIIPIGYKECDDKRGNQMTLLKAYVNQTPFNQKKTRILLTHCNITHASRKTLRDKLQGKDFIDYGEKLDFDKYLSKIDEYKFVLSPRGNGFDTHRFYEILITGSIPIVERDDIAHLYEKFNCIIIDNFSNLTIEHLEKFEYDSSKTGFEDYVIIN